MKIRYTESLLNINATALRLGGGQRACRSRASRAALRVQERKAEGKEAEGGKKPDGGGGGQLESGATPQ